MEGSSEAPFVPQICHGCGNSSSQDEEKPRPTDHISEVPDSLLLHILSFLKMEEVLQTSLLSRRWKNLWKHTLYLDFTSVANSKFLDEALAVHKSPKVFRFRICIDSPESARQIDSWINFALTRDVEELYIDLGSLWYGHMPYALPYDIFNCNSLLSLRLDSCDLSLPNSFCLPSLKTLHLLCVNVSDQDFKKFISSCPLLDNMLLDSCNQITYIDVSAADSCLKTLTLSEYFPEYFLHYKIFAPSVLTLYINDQAVRRSYNITNLSSLVTIEFNVGWNNDADEPESVDICNDSSMKFSNLLFQIRHAQTLRLCSWCLQVLSFLEFQNKGLSFSFDASLLVLNIGLKKWELLGIGCALRCFNKLETLKIDIDQRNPKMNFAEDFLLECDFDERSFWKSSDRSFPFSLQHTKVIKIRYLKGWCWEPEDAMPGCLSMIKENEIDFITFLLKKSPVLERLTVCFSNDSRHWMRDPEFLSNLAFVLLELPRASPSAQVLFNVY